jgi:hypothetical protein
LIVRNDIMPLWPSSDGATVRRCDGATVRRCDGAMVRWCDGAMVRNDIIVMGLCQKIRNDIIVMGQAR